MLSEADEYVLSCSLSALVRNLPLLDDLLVPSVVAAGERLGSGGGSKSRPPVSLGVLDVKRDAEGVLFGWAGCLAEYPGVVLPVTREGWVYAQWLLVNVDLVGLMEWASDCVQEVCEAAARVRELVDPAESAVVAAPVDVPVDVVVDPSVWMVSAREASRVLARLGVSVSHVTISRWAKSGVVTAFEVGVDRLNVDVREVREVARRKQGLPSSRLGFCRG